MSEDVENVAVQEPVAAEVAPLKLQTKKLFIIGGAVLGVSVLAGGIAAWALSSHDEPVQTAAPKNSPAKPTHVVAIAPPAPVADPRPAHAEPHATSSAASAAAASSAVIDGLKAEIRSLEEEKKQLLQEQIRMLKRQKATQNKSTGLAGEKACQLSGNKETRKDELRACFGIAAADEKKHVAHDWSYSGNKGPEYWGKLKPEFSACESGHQQSPINIVGSGQKGAPDLKFDYRPSTLKLVNNGHTLQVSYDKGSHISVDGQKYELVQFHFHTPSEELINGRMADMVVHLVHKNASGKLAVVGVLMDRGKEHAGLASWWAKLPQEPGSEAAPPGLKADAARLLPSNTGQYYSYEGSLTTPPCSEGVRWFVMKNRVSLSDAQLKRFTDLYPYNARPVQPRYERVVWER